MAWFLCTVCIYLYSSPKYVGGVFLCSIPNKVICVLGRACYIVFVARRTEAGSAAPPVGTVWFGSAESTWLLWEKLEQWAVLWWRTCICLYTRCYGVCCSWSSNAIWQVAFVFIALITRASTTGCGSAAEWLEGRIAINRSRVRIPAAALPCAILTRLSTHTCPYHQAV